jgi:predicted Fe-Mo cluster-binding NifX family protein
MRIAVPVANGVLSMHFGHCEAFTLVDVDPDSRAIVNTEETSAPPHQPGLLPRWLGEQGVDVVIAGGMGQRAHSLFAEQNVSVVVGASPVSPEVLVKDYLDGTLQTGENVCDH